jgi:hypothetical protein
MKVAVVSAYYKETPLELQRCIDSVAGQTHACTHFLVSDGHPQALLDNPRVRHVTLGASHADYGDTPRAIGSLLAIREGFDAIAYLDADNFFLRDHIKVMIDALDAAGGTFDIVTSRRFLLRPNGTRLPIPDESWQSHTDTNCYLILRGGFALTPIWALMPREFSMIGDRIFWRAIVTRGCRIAHVPRESVGYRTLWKIHYERAGEAPPEGAKDFTARIQEVARWWAALPGPDQAAINLTLGFDAAALFG